MHDASIMWTDWIEFILFFCVWELIFIEFFFPNRGTLREKEDFYLQEKKIFKLHYHQVILRFSDHITNTQRIKPI